MNIRLFKPSIFPDDLESVQDTFERSCLGLAPMVMVENAWEEYTLFRSYST